MRYAVLGAAGQLGRALCPHLPGDVVPLNRQQIDLTRPEMVRSALGELRPDIVINCAAYNLVNQAESELEVAFAVNAWGVRALAQACAERDCALVHFSTNYVFGLDSDRETPYRETDAPGPVNFGFRLRVAAPRAAQPAGAPADAASVPQRPSR